jgi:hypothetical protein
VAFLSRATDLTGDTIDVTPNVFVRDRDADADGVFDETGPGESRTTLLSIGIDGTAAGTISGSGPGPGQGPVISGTGAFVAFVSRASDIRLDDPTLTDFNGDSDDVFLANVATGEISLVSVNGSGTGSSPTSGTASDLSISNAGVVSFASSHSGLISAATGSVDDTNGAGSDIFVGRGNSPVVPVSINRDGTGTSSVPGGGVHSRMPAISGNGRHVAFLSRTTDLVGATDTNFAEDLFVRDLEAGTTTLVSRSQAVPGSFATGNAGTTSSTLLTSEMSISDDGRFIDFRSGATDLLDPTLGIVDENAAADVFRYDRDPDRDGSFDELGETAMILVSVNAAGTASTLHTGVGAGVAASSVPSSSRDGRYVAFASTGRDLISGGTPFPGGHVYIRDMVTGATTLVSETASGAGGGPSFSPMGARPLALSRDGTRVAFQSVIDASELDPAVTDPPNTLPVPFGEIDVFAGTPDGDIIVAKNYTNGTDEHVQGFRIAFEEVAPFDLSYYRSSDADFDAGDELLGTIGISDPSLLLPTTFTQALFTTIGTDPGEIPFPGIGSADPLEDYFILAVGDDTDVIPEFDVDPFNEDNTDRLVGVYEEPDGPVFAHGGRVGDAVTASVVADMFELTFGTTLDLTPTTYTYPLSDGKAARVRLHGGDDVFTGSERDDAAFGGDGSDELSGEGGDDSLFGGPGKDVLDGGDGDDTLDGGPGPDRLTGGPGVPVLCFDRFHLPLLKTADSRVCFRSLATS